MQSTEQSSDQAECFRSAVNSTSGVRTTFGGVFTALIIILACAFLSPYLAFIPTAALSAVIVFSMFFTINYAMPKDLWNAKSRHNYAILFFLIITFACRVGPAPLHSDFPSWPLLECGDGSDCWLFAPSLSSPLPTVQT